MNDSLNDSFHLKTDSFAGLQNKYFSMKLTSIAKLSEKFPKKIRKNYLDRTDVKNRSIQFSNLKHCYTTLNSSIKYIADIVYEEIGEGVNKHQMSYSNFENWISKNEGILMTFDKWLRREIWGSSSSSGIPSSLSSIPEASIEMEGYAKINMKPKNKRLKIYSRNFLVLKANILFVYQSREKVQLKNLYILKDLNFYFDKYKRKIKIKHDKSVHYLNLTMILENVDTFLLWKKAYSPFIMESVEKYYLIKEKIGRGTFSTVNLAEQRSDPSRRFAIKTIDKETLKSDEKLLIKEEAKIIQGLNHENIIKFYDHYEDYKKAYYVFEFVEGGDLLEHVLKKGKLPEREAKKVFVQLLRVLKYLHRKNILHRDLKPENILLEFDSFNKIRKIKLIDFGFATFFSKNDLPTLSCGTLNYAAPEVLVGEQYDESSDLFSCGVILYFM
jgi:tRNA A-37 threonylcarbamoyl transferase component Bud32